MKFNELPLQEPLLKAIAAMGYEDATEIQVKAIENLGHQLIDFVGQAQTGTGKTAAFSLPLLNQIDPNERSVQAIILSPTRELANQINGEIKKFSKFSKIKTLSVYGGVPISTQIQGLRKDRPQIIVGTPGRVLDLIKRGVLKLEDAKVAVLDEADEMLDMGFIDDVKEILSKLGDKRKTWMFSATMPRAILDLIKNYLVEPVVVSIKKKTLSNENIDQLHYVIHYRNMTEAVCRLLDSLDDNPYGIIFCRTRVETKNLADILNERGYKSDSLHGDMSQQQRDLTMRKFKEKKVKLLVCTDVAARGIDVENLTHVINYGLPQDLEAYVHRIGRTGRAGAKGIAMSIVEPGDRYRLRQLENLTKAKIRKEMLPSSESLKDSMVKREVQKFEGIYEMLEANDKLDETYKHFEGEFEHLDKEGLMRVMFTHLFSNKLKLYSSNKVLDFDDKGRNESTATRGAARTAGNVRMFVNVGKEHGLTLDTLLGSIADKANIEKGNINNVDLKNEFSFIEIPSANQDAVLAIRDFMVGERKVRFELTKSGNGGGGSRRGGGGGFRGRTGGGGRSGGGRSGGGRSGGGARTGERSSGSRPSGNRPGGRPDGNRSGGNRSGGNSTAGSNSGGNSFR